MAQNLYFCYNPLMPQDQNTPWVLAMYDQIMGEIEPDLLTTQIPLLDEKYKNETPEQKKNRMAAYAQAFKIFDEAFKGMAGEMYGEIEKLKHAAQESRTSAEEKQRSDDVSSAEDQLSSSSDHL